MLGLVFGSLSALSVSFIYLFILQSGNGQIVCVSRMVVGGADDQQLYRQQLMIMPAIPAYNIVGGFFLKLQ